ncbi:MAG: hypothetical protein ACJ8C4_19735 [Gemmataceae bacterium]
MRRLFYRGVLLLGLLVVGGYVAFQCWLNSSHAAGLVAGKLQARLGVPVTVGGVEVGTSSCAARNVGICELESANQPPFLTVGRAETDLGFRELIGGNAEPSVMTLNDAHLTLRHDRDGHLLTRLPKPAGPPEKIPEMRLQNASVTIKHEGDPDCDFHGINAVVKIEAGQLSLTGTVDDPDWGGQWQANGTAPADVSSGTVTLTSKGVHVTHDTLTRIPYVPQNIWSHFTAEGDTPVSLRLMLPARHEAVRYRVELSPTNVVLYVPSIDLHADRASGKVVVEDNLLLLKDVRGRVADGEMFLKSAELDFRKPDTHMHYVLEGSKMNLRGLPASWRLPPRLGGKLSGQSDLTVDIVRGRTIPTGSGDCRVDNAMLGVIPIPNYSLKIQADANGFRFEPRLSR